MRRASTVFAVVALIGFYVTAGSSGRFSVFASPLELQQTSIPRKNPLLPSEKSIKAGMVVYANGCRPCHGLRGKGDGVAPPPGSTPANLVDDKWDHGSSDVEIFKTIKEGVAPDYFMQAWDGEISDTDIWNVINYIRSLGPKDAKR